MVKEESIWKGASYRAQCAFKELMQRTMTMYDVTAENLVEQQCRPAMMT